jgi:hypothetical protein
MTVRKLKKQPVKKKRRYWIIGIIILITIGFLTSSFPSAKGEDYTFGSENVIKGTSGSPANRNAEDGSFQTLTEANQYSDTYFSGSSESMTYGTNGGGSFPTALDTDDSTRRNYIESNLAAGATYAILRPTSDGSPLTMVTIPASPTTHYTKVDETTAGGNGDTDYTEGVTNGQSDTYGMSDTSGSGNFDVTIWHISSDEGATSNLQVGLHIGASYYIGWQGDLNSGVYTNYSYTWTIDPSTSAEWTLANINALQTYLTVTDANPDTRTTQIALYITLNPVADYEMQGTITYSSVLSTSQTTGFSVLCQGYRSNSENFYVQAWDYTTTTWITKVTINSASDTDFNFDLSGWNTNHERSSGNEVKLRLIDVTGSDTTLDTLYLDLLKIKRTELGYALEVEMTASATNTYGNQQLYIKGKTSAETFNVAVYNWDTTSWETNKISITSTSNTVYTYTLTAAQRSGTQQVKIQFIDGTSYTADQVQDICSLDYIAVKWIHSDPTITSYRTSQVQINIGDSTIFWLTYTDIDNEVPTYAYTHIGSTDYSMSANDSDTTYYDGKLYGLTKSDLTAGNTTYYFKVKDANSGDITTSPVGLSVNTKPTLTLDGISPATGNPQTYTFFVTYSDADSNSPQYVKVNIDTIDYTMTYNGTGGGYHYDKSMSAGTHPYYFTTQDYRSGIISTTPKNLIVNNPPTLSNQDRTPTDPVYKNTQLNFTVTYTDLDNDAPTSIKWREDNGTTQNITMSEIDNSDTNYVNGKDYYTLIYLEHGTHWYDYYAFDSKASVSIGDYSITISNRNPVITDYPSTPINLWRNQAYNFDFNATDADTDTITWEKSGESWMTINPSSGIFSGTTSNTPNNYPFTIWANDSFSGTTYYAFNLIISNRNPVISSSGNITQMENTFLSYQIIASDPDSDSLTYELYTNASWASISSNYVNGTAIGIGWYTFSVWANDSYGGTDIEYWTLNVTSIPANLPPYFISVPIYDGTNITWYIYIAIGFDPESNPLTYSLNGNATFLTINSTSGTIYGTPVLIGNYSVNVTVFDGTEYGYQNYTLYIKPFSGSGVAADYNLIGVVGITISLLICVGAFSLTKSQKKRG